MLREGSYGSDPEATALVKTSDVPRVPRLPKAPCTGVDPAAAIGTTQHGPSLFELRQVLTARRNVVARAVGSDFLDLNLALSLHDKVAALLERWDVFSLQETQSVAEVVQYLVDTDDEEHDLLSPIGLVDDEEQVSELLRRLASHLLS